MMRELVCRLADHLRLLDRQTKELEQQIERWHRESESSRRLAAIPGIGPITATALVASIGDARTFKSGRQLAAWLGLMPRQHSSGGKWVQAGLAVARATRQRFEARLHAILEHRPNLLTERERQTLWQILFGRDTENHGSREQPMTALETELLKMADRLSCVLNLRGQGGVP